MSLPFNILLSTIALAMPSIPPVLGITTSPVQVSANGIQGQWVKPNIVRNKIDVSTSGDYTMFGSASSSGQFNVSKRLANGSITTVELAKNESDDHNVPGLLQLASGHWVAFWNRHSINGQNGIRYALTATPHGMDFGPMQIVAGVISGGGVTNSSYSQMWLLGSRIWAMYRTGNSSSGVWVIRYSDDNCTTWSTERTLTPTAYLDSSLDGNTLHCVMYNHPVNQSKHNIWTFTVDLISGDVSANGAVIGNVLTNTDLPVAEASARLAVNITTGTSRLFGQSKNGEYVYAMTMASATDIGTYIRYKRTASGLYEAQVVSTAGYAFMGGGQAYFGGICHLDNNTVLCAVNKGSSVGVGSWALEQWKTTNGGTTWTLEGTIKTSTNIIARPQAMDDQIFWSSVSVYTSYTSWTSTMEAAKSLTVSIP